MFSLWRRRHRPHHHHDHHHHRHSSPSAVKDLGIRHIIVHLSGVRHMSVTIVGTTPTTRKSQTVLNLNEIDSIKLFRNGEEIDSLVPTSATFTFRDLTPLTGADDYTVKTLTKDGFISDESNVASVSVVGADPASAVSDLQASVDGSNSPPSSRGRR